MTYSLRRRMIKSEARRILFFDFRICICVSGLIMLLLFGISAFFRFVDQILYGLLSKNGFYALSALIRFLMAVFVSPFLSSCVSFYRRLSCNDRQSLFFPDDSFLSVSGVRRSCRDVFFIALSALVSLYLPALLFRLVGVISDYFNHTLLSIVIKCAVLVFGVLSVTLAVGFAPIFRCSFDFAGIKQCFFYMKGHKLEFVCFLFSFVPLFLLSYLSFGILLLFVIPYFMISVSCFLNYAISEKSAPVLRGFS